MRDAAKHAVQCPAGLIKLICCLLRRTKCGVCFSCSQPKEISFSKYCILRHRRPKIPRSFPTGLLIRPLPDQHATPKAGRLSRPWRHAGGARCGDHRSQGLSFVAVGRERARLAQSCPRGARSLIARRAEARFRLRCRRARWRICKVRLEQAQRVRRDHEGARASSGDQHGSNQNPHNFALGHRDYSPNPSLPILSPSYFCSGRCRLKIPGRPCGLRQAIRQAQQGPDLQQERPQPGIGAVADFLPLVLARRQVRTGQLLLRQQGAMHADDLRNCRRLLLLKPELSAAGPRPDTLMIEHDPLAPPSGQALRNLDTAGRGRTIGASAPKEMSASVSPRVRQPPAARKTGPPAVETPPNLFIYDVLINLNAPLAHAGIALPQKARSLPSPQYPAATLIRDPERGLFNIAHIQKLSVSRRPGEIHQARCISDIAGPARRPRFPSKIRGAEFVGLHTSPTTTGTPRPFNNNRAIRCQ